MADVGSPMLDVAIGSRSRVRFAPPAARASIFPKFFVAFRFEKGSLMFAGTPFRGSAIYAPPCSSDLRPFHRRGSTPPFLAKENAQAIRGSRDQSRPKRLPGAHRGS